MRRLLTALVLVLFYSLSSFSQDKIKIAVMDFKPGVGVSESTVDGISEMLISSLFDTRQFLIIERTQIDKTFQEQGFQKVNTTTDQIAQVGKILGVKYVLIGIVNFIITERTLEDVATSMAKGEYNIDVRIVNVESGLVVSTAGTGVKRSETIRSVMPKLANDLAKKIEYEVTGTTDKVYKIGDFGPAGGRVFYDKGIFSNGWRYLEAAPLETEFIASWGLNKQEVEGTRTSIGFGKSNTIIILNQLSLSCETGKAATLCDELVFDGYDDWFLPSSDELYLMYENIRSLTDISELYWSSSVSSNPLYSKILKAPYINSEYRGNELKVRAIRAF